jgi:hypothetical protein
MRSLSMLFLLLFSSLSFGQDDSLYKWGSPTTPYRAEGAGDLRANRYDYNSLENRYGAGSPYKSDGLMNRSSRSGNRYSNDSWTNPYATNSPSLSTGGRLSSNRYDYDSTSNPYGQYGSRYSYDSINNRYGAGNKYQTRPLYVYPSWRRW